MKIDLPEDFEINFRDFFRKGGYSPLIGVENKESYVRRLSRDYYPRFHAYVNTDGDGRKFLSIHLDQKKASYAGSSDHNAEYDGELVEKEARVIEDDLKALKNRRIDQFNEEESKKGFFSLFKNK